MTLAHSNGKSAEATRPPHQARTTQSQSSRVPAGLLLPDPRIQARGNRVVQQAALLQLQTTYGNAAVGQLFATTTSRPAVQRTEQFGSGTAGSPEVVPPVQRVLKNDPKGTKSKKIRSSATYKEYKGYDKAKVDYWLDDSSVDIEAETITHIKNLLTEEKEKYLPDYLATWTDLELKEWLDNDASARNKAPDQARDRVSQALLQRQRPTASTPQALGLDTLRDVSISQPPTATKAPESDSRRSDISGSYGKKWKKDVNDKSAPALELDSWARGVPHMSYTDAAGEKLMCPACEEYYPSNRFTTDHQIPFESLKRKAHDLAFQASLSPDHVAAVRKQFLKFDDYFVADEFGNWHPTNAMINDYSNDMKNLFRICGGCNSIIGAKGTASPREWFENVPLFGAGFTAWATKNYSGSEFFGNPTVGRGWGAAARKWVASMASHFGDILESLSQLKASRTKRLRKHASRVGETAKLSGPDALVKQKKAKEKFGNTRFAVKAGLAVEEKVNKRKRMSGYGSGSDEESNVKLIEVAVNEKLEGRERKKRKKEPDYEKALTQNLAGAGPGVGSILLQEAHQDAEQRRHILKQLALHDLAQVPYGGAPLEGSTTEDARLRSEAKLFYETEINKWMDQARKAGSEMQACPMLPPLAGMNMEVYIKLQGLINAEHSKGLALAKQYAERSSDVS